MEDADSCSGESRMGADIELPRLPENIRLVQWPGPEVEVRIGPVALRVFVLAVVAALVATLPSALASSVRIGAPAQVICVSNSSVEPVYGNYVVRPRTCSFHEPNKPAAYAYLIEMRRMHWRHWGAKEANGTGVSLANMIGPVRTKVRLSASREVCGHRVFTVAHFKFNGLHSSGHGFELDRSLQSAC